ncbi:MAG: radical SAM family heme chaperone HemW [Ruminococcus sp.]|nr:radical SAM family heme chaperone HemW [Ruminococcus sp.]
MKNVGIYIHVPFCGKKCSYCDFYSVCYTKQQTELYVQAVLRNIRHYGDSALKADTVYFGGGTPSLLTPEQITEILSAVRNNFDLADNAEATMEANPATLTPEKLSAYLSAGINRLSIGVQSMNDDELRFLGRLHNAERAEKAVYDAAAAGFENISCDLMIALPSQKTESLKRSIQRLAALPIKHISAYILKVEEGTPFDCDEIIAALPDEDEAAELYLTMCEELESRGFMQYEVSNFAKSGFESRHNCRYWKCQDYIGIGPSAHSCFGGKRFAVPRDIASFINSDIQQTEITDDAPCGFEEYSMLRLRLKEGLSLERVPEHRADIEKKLPSLLKAGYIEYDGNVVSLTRKGFLMSNSVIEYLIF